MRCKQKILALLFAVALLLAMSSTALADVVVCEMNGTEYTSLAEAVAKVPIDGTQTTITLLKDTTGDGVVVEKGKNIIFDLGGNAYIVDGTVGSSGTETNGFQLLKGSTVTFKNGTINAGKAKILIQNYADLMTLEDVTLNAEESAVCQYVCSNNCGTVNIIGDTNIYAAAGQAAFDVYYWPKGGYADGVIVNVDTTGTIAGRIDYTNDGSDPEHVAEKAKLIIKSGNFTGTFSISEGSDGKTGVTISGGTFTDAATAATIENYLASGFELVNGQVVPTTTPPTNDDDDSSIGYPPTILSPTGNQVVAVMANGTVTLSVDATGVGFGGYQWYVNRGEGRFVPVAGATGPSLTLYPTFADNGSQYYCQVRNGYGYVDSGYFTLSVVGGMVPKTGDQVSVTLWVCLMALGVAGAAAALARRRSR